MPMKSPDTRILLSTVLAGAIGFAALSSSSAFATEIHRSFKPPLPTPASSGTPTGTENPYHLVPAPCETSMPWNDASLEQTQTKSVVVFTSVKRPQSTTKPGVGPECWQVVKGN